MPLPYGKQLTLVMDAKVLWSSTGRRPGLDKFLARAVAKYEIVLFGSPEVLFIWVMMVYICRWKGTIYHLQIIKLM